MASEREVRKLEKVFAEKRDQLQEFIADHGQVFDLFFGLVDEYNTALGLELIPCLWGS